MAPEPALMAGWQRRYNSQTMHCGANHPINDRSMTHARHPHEKRGLFHRFSNVDKALLCKQGHSKKKKIKLCPKIDFDPTFDREPGHEESIGDVCFQF